MRSQSDKDSSAVKIPTINDADVYNGISKAYEQIEKETYDGNVVAEKALMALDQLFDDDFPNYFVAGEDLNYNIMMVERPQEKAMNVLNKILWFIRQIV